MGSTRVERSPIKFMDSWGRIGEILTTLVEKIREYGGEQGDLYHAAVSEAETTLINIVKVILGMAVVTDLSPERIVRESPSPGVRERVVEEVSDQQVLFEAATTDNVGRVREAARDKLTDEGLLLRILLEDRRPEVYGCEIVARKLSQEGILAQVALQHENFLVQSSAVCRMSDLGFQSAIADVIIDADKQLEGKTVYDKGVELLTDSKQQMRVFWTASRLEARYKVLYHWYRQPLDRQWMEQALIGLESFPSSAIEEAVIDFLLSITRLLARLTDEDQRSLRRIARQAKSMRVARVALCHLASGGLTLPNVDQAFLERWRIEQAQAE